MSIQNTKFFEYSKFLFLAAFIVNLAIYKSDPELYRFDFFSVQKLIFALLLLNQFLGGVITKRANLGSFVATKQDRPYAYAFMIYLFAFFAFVFLLQAY